MDEIDKLIASSSPPKERKRKGNDPIRGSEKIPSNPAKALVEEGTRAYEIATLLRQGRSVHDIAETYGVPQKEIKRLLEKALLALAEDVGPVILNWSVMSIARLEEMISKLYPKLIDDNDNHNDVVYARVQNLIAQEKEIVTMLMAGSKKDVLSDLNETMLGGGKLYDEGTKALNDRRVNGVIEREQPISDLDNPFPGGIVYQDAKK